MIFHRKLLNIFFRGCEIQLNVHRRKQGPLNQRWFEVTSKAAEIRGFQPQNGPMIGGIYQD
ncbi:MAG: hypothetical protein CMJ77_20685 [Planctomycetaceae bacterium]|nr:hypothetical protein [Planctomycetaceae bacterium]